MVSLAWRAIQRLRRGCMRPARSASWMRKNRPGVRGPVLTELDQGPTTWESLEFDVRRVIGGLPAFGIIHDGAGRNAALNLGASRVRQNECEGLVVLVVAVVFNRYLEYLLLVALVEYQRA